MHTKDLVVQISNQTGLNRKQVRSVIELLKLTIKRTVLVEGDTLEMAGLGVFYLRTLQRKEMVNPATGERLKVTPRMLVGFRCAKNSKRLITADEVGQA